MIADNKLAQNAGWDNEVLAIELDALSSAGLEIEVSAFPRPRLTWSLTPPLKPRLPYVLRKIASPQLTRPLWLAAPETSGRWAITFLPVAMRAINPFTVIL